jgi:hypothetical protein
MVQKVCEIWLSQEKILLSKLRDCATLLTLRYLLHLGDGWTVQAKSAVRAPL